MYDDIEDRIEAWHNSNSTLPLHEYLGMTWEEYAAWVVGYAAWVVDGAGQAVA